MKKFFPLLMLALALNTRAQIPISPGDTLGPWTVIDFETPSPWIVNSPSIQNLWLTGAPQNTIFNQAYTVPNAIATGLDGYYMVNNHSWFDLIVGDFNTMQSFGWSLYIDFRHRIDSDTLHDGGYITVSWDHGQTWVNIIDDTLSMMCYECSPGDPCGDLGNTNLYNHNDLLFNGEHGFSGTNNGWRHSCMAWFDIPVKNYLSPCADTLLVRFNFISDNIHNNREGWMIDQIRIFSIDLGGGENEYHRNMLKISVAPNPVPGQTTVTLNQPSAGLEYQLLDLTGNPVMTGNPDRCQRFVIDRQGLPAGLYLLRVTSNSAAPATTRLVFL